jgi:ferritin-like metal-binding protein YciE
MAPEDLQEQLTKYLTDVHAIEQQALAQMHTAPGLAGDEQIAEAFSLHLSETEQHERLIHELLRARGASPSTIKDIAGLLTGHGFGLFAAFQPDTPGKLVVHAFSYEHMEEGTYDMLGTIATRAGDNATLEVARRIEAQEHAMGDRLDALFDRAVEVSLRDVEAEALDAQLNTYLTDAHAIEIQALELLKKAVKLAEGSELASVYERHLLETEEHEQLIAARLRARGGEPSMIKDAALRLGALNWGGFFGAQPDTLTKLTVFAYAFEHLEIGAYELLKRVAERAGDHETAEVAQRIIGQETDAARIVRALFSAALDATLTERNLA